MVRSLYIHIPFCARKCRYCDFYSVVFSEDAAESYVHALCRELLMRRADAGTLESVYIGGGTPTLLPVAGITEILDAVFGNYGVAPGAEVTLEANPGTITPEKLERLAGAGVSRLSIGVQSLRDPELAVLWRSHSADEARRAVRAARDAGFQSLSIDLIYGLPGQTPESWGDALEEALSLKPEHISAYELTVEEGTPLHDAVRRGHVTMPDDDAVAAMYFKTSEVTALDGFHQYEISNYARPGHECRHNLNCWDRGEYLGAGAGAHSFIRGQRTANVRDLSRYAASVGRRELPVAESQRIGEKEALAEMIFLGLRKTEGIDTRLLPEKARRDMNKAAEELVSLGLAELSQNLLRLTPRGLVLSSEIMVRLLSAL